MRHHGLATHTRILPGSITEASGAQAAELLQRQGPLPAAMITFNDRAAVRISAQGSAASSDHRSRTAQHCLAMPTALAEFAHTLGRDAEQRCDLLPLDVGPVPATGLTGTACTSGCTSE
jgi:hypothetical protein